MKKLLFLCILIFTTDLSAKSIKRQYISIGTGGVTGLYFPAGGAICRLINRHKNDHGVQCSVESTGGSVYNLNALSTGELDFGVSQSDLIHHAYQKTNKVKAIRSNDQLRTVLSFYTEPLTVVARQDANIKEFQALKGSRVNIGAPGSGQRATVMNLIDAMGWNIKKDFAQISGLNPVEQATALCDNKLQAIMYSVGHPNGSIQEASSLCKTNLVHIRGPEIKSFLSTRPYYLPTQIDGGLYKGSPDPITTFGVKVSLLTSLKTDIKIVKQMVRSIYNNFESFKRIHPLFTQLTTDSIFKEGIVAPLHPGVTAFLKEKNQKKELPPCPPVDACVPLSDDSGDA